MNKAEHEFKPGDSVVFLSEDKITKGEVTGVQIIVNQTETNVRYLIKNDGDRPGKLQEYRTQVFKDKKALIASL